MPERGAFERLLHEAAQPKQVTDEEPGADSEADQRAIEDEFWNKK